MPTVSASRYYPLRALIGWTVVFAGIWFFAMPYARAPLLDALSGLDRIHAIAKRFFDNAYEQALFVLLGGAIIYVVLQILAVLQDQRVLAVSRPAGPMAAALGVLSGRSYDFWNAEFVDNKGVDHNRAGPGFTQTPLQILLWVFPMFGFLGTVYGLSGAVGQLSNITATKGGLDPDKLQPVFSELDVAFDTTIQGIVSAVILAALILPLDISWNRLRQFK